MLNLAKLYKLGIVSTLTSVALLSFHNTFAFDVPSLTLPNSIDPAKQGNQISAPTTLKVAPTLPIIATRSTVLPTAAEKIKFTLHQLNITGNTLYTINQLTPLYKNYLGKQISLADLQKIADNITKKYRENGYFLSKAIIPAQKISHGVVNLQIIEGYAANVTVVGTPKGARSLIQAYGNKLTQSRPLNIADLERTILLANDIPGATVKAILSPAQNTTTVGAADVTLIANQSIANGYFSYDNRGTRFLGPQQYSFGGSVNSILRAGDQTSLQGLLSYNAKQLQFYRLSHQTPLSDSGLKLNIAASYSLTRPNYTLAKFDVRGLSNSFSAGLTYPVIRSRATNLNVGANFEMQNSKTDILGENQYTDHIRALRANGNFSATDSWYGFNQLGTQISQGLPVFGANRNDDKNISRSDARNNFTKITLDAARVQRLTDNFSLLAATTGQYAFSSLYAAEQFSFGGSQFGQAYDPSEISGDHGLAAKIELRYDSYPNLGLFLQNIQYFAFYDIGKVWNVKPETLVGQTSGASAGLGARVNFNKYLSGALVVAEPLTAPAGAKEIRTPRVFFNITIAGDTPNGNTTMAAMNPPPPVYQPVPKAVTKQLNA